MSKDFLAVEELEARVAELESALEDAKEVASNFKHVWFDALDQLHHVQDQRSYQRGWEEALRRVALGATVSVHLIEEVPVFAAADVYYAQGSCTAHEAIADIAQWWAGRPQ